MRQKYKKSTYGFLTFAGKLLRMPETPIQVTILLPFYKVGAEFDRAVESIAQQTFQHWQLLLISNNGNSTGLEAAQKWIEKDGRIKLLHEPRQGIAFALNAGLLHCHSPYIARMDADDISHP
jgi:glycosyltransferase involved in cell wall biosynthesis